MSTSGTYSFTVTRDDIIRQALLNIKRLDPDDSPLASETNDCARTLNMMCKQWMGKSDFAPGLKVWTRQYGHLLLSGTTGIYTVGPGATGWTNNLTASTTASTVNTGATAITVSSATGFANGQNIAIQLDSGTLFYTTISTVAGTTINLVGTMPSKSSSGSMAYAYSTVAQMPLNIEAAWLRDNVNSDTPLKIMQTVQEYAYLPNKNDVTNISDPAAILYETGLTNGTLRTDVGAAQDMSKHIVLAYMESVQDFNAPLDNPYYPQEWYLALCWGLSEQICPMFGANWTTKMEDLKKNALAIARNKGAETSALFFQPGVEE